jgi:hypothetical protein
MVIVAVHRIPRQGQTHQPNMKSFNSALIIILLIAAVFFFTKPADETCQAKAREILAGSRPSTPGYENPMTENAKGPIAPEAIFVKDKVLWKEVDYIQQGQVKVLGYGWLGSFHKRSAEKR